MTITVAVMKKCLGHIMCLDDNWVSLNTDDVNTTTRFFKGMHSILHYQIVNKKFLLAKIQEATCEKAEELALQNALQKDWD
jgi:hypothetical protein